MIHRTNRRLHCSLVMTMFTLSLTIAHSLLADELDVSLISPGSWKHADRWSGKATPGLDSRGRLHIRVRPGDIVYFYGAGQVLFENGSDETGATWQSINPTSGPPSPALNPLPQGDDRRQFYLNPDKVLTADQKGVAPPPPQGFIIAIEIKTLTVDHPILFACGDSSHKDNRGFGAITLEND